MQVNDPQWSCRINEGVAGITSVQWSPDARHIITTADFHLSLTIWPLDNHHHRPLVIKKPKPTGPLAFFIPSPSLPSSSSSHHELLAVVTRSQCKDYVSMYRTTGGWPVLRTFQLDTLDCVGLSWSPQGTALAVQDTCLVYGLQVVDPQGNTLMRYQAYRDALGIRAMAWSPSGTAHHYMHGRLEGGPRFD